MLFVAWILCIALLVGLAWMLVWAWRVLKRDGISSLEDGPGLID